jgi:uncharacterized membrane protein
LNSADILSEFPTTAEELAAYEALVVSDLTRESLNRTSRPTPSRGPT